MAVGVFGGHQVLGLLRVHKSELVCSNLTRNRVLAYQHYSDMTARSIHLEVVQAHHCHDCSVILDGEALFVDAKRNFLANNL